MLSSICNLCFRSRNLSAKLIGWIASIRSSAVAVTGHRIYLPSHILCQTAPQQEVALCLSHRPYVTHLSICLTHYVCIYVCVCKMWVSLINGCTVQAPEIRTSFAVQASFHSFTKAVPPDGSSSINRNCAPLHSSHEGNRDVSNANER